MVAQAHGVSQPICALRHVLLSRLRVAIGPMLSSLTGIPADTVLRLGAKAGAGFNWRLSRDAALFGSYDITTTTVDGFTSPGAKAPATALPSGYDVLYGVRLRY